VYGKGNELKLIFALTAGRTGSAFLAELLKSNVPSADVHHEILSFGVGTPDISHLHAYNTFGNTPYVQTFWQHKMEKILAGGKACYVETAHVLMKVGLVENVISLAAGHDIHFIRLTRNVLHTLISYHERGDFLNRGNMWMWYLDPAYARNILNAEPFQQYGIPGVRWWYVNEIAARAELLRQQYSQYPHVHFHTADLYDLNQKESATALFKQLGLAVSDVVIPPKENVNARLVPISPEEKAALELLLQRNAGIDPVQYVQTLLREQKVT
jgi:hypothetical protein